MIDGRSKRNSLNTIGLFLSLGVIATAMVLRLIFLSSDPPYFFAGTGQDLLTDPYNVTSFARNKILFGSWDIFNYPRWIFFKYSLSSAASYIFFLIGGVSRTTANLSAILLNLTGLSLFSLGMLRESKKSGLITMLLLVTNMTMFVYGRFPFLENGLIFLCGLLFYIFTRYHYRNWGFILSAILAALCALSGKVFGIVMIIPVSMVLLSERNNAPYKRTLLFLGATFLSIILFALIFYGREIGTVYSYITEQTIGMYGTPNWVVSPMTFFTQIFSLNRELRLFFAAPLLFSLLFLYFCGLLTLPSNKIKIIFSNQVFLFNIVWLVSGFLLLMIFNYQPLRYQLFLLLPLCGILSSLYADPISPTGNEKIRISQIVLLIFLCWFAVAQFAFSIFGDPSNQAISALKPWLYLALSLIPVAVIVIFRNIYFKLIGPRSIIPTALLALNILIQASWIYQGFNKPTYDLKMAGADLAQIVNSDAIVIGPYAQALNIDNNLRSFVYMFGLPNKEDNLFQKFHCTHLATDITNEQVALKDYPELEGRMKLARYWVRDVTVNILAVPDQENAGQYTPTDYEKASKFYVSQKFDSALSYLQKFLGKFPENKSAITLQSNCYFQTGNIDKGLDIYAKLMTIYPNDYSLYFDLALLQYKIYLMTGKKDKLEQSSMLFRKAVDINPCIDKDIIRAKKQAEQGIGR